MYMRTERCRRVTQTDTIFSIQVYTRYNMYINNFKNIIGTCFYRPHSGFIPRWLLTEVTFSLVELT